jgi:sugar/nucleoside kinase (ribokinase family)
LKFGETLPRKTIIKKVTPDLVVVGSVALDILHTQKVTTRKLPGGSAIHFANAASLFCSVGIVGIVGEDYPHEKIHFLHERGVDFSGLETGAGKTFLWEGRYSEDFGTRETIRTELGVFAEFNPKIPAHFRRPRVLFLAAIAPSLQMSVLNQVEETRLVALDTFKLWIDTRREGLIEIIRRVDLIFLNDDEVRWLTGEQSLLRGANIIRQMGPKWVVVKKGEHGSFLLSEKGLFMVPPFPVEEVLDPTGAGDAFAGGVLGYLASQSRFYDSTFRRALGWGSVVGSFYVEGYGPEGLRNVNKTTLGARYRDYQKMIQVS